MKEKIENLKAKLTNGVSPAMATPLTSDGYHVNVEVVPLLVDFLIGKGVKGLFVGGTTGEGILLSLAERKQLHEATVQATHGRVPLLVHVGDNRQDVAEELASHAAQLEVDAIVAVTPYYYGLDDDALGRYFGHIADAAPATPLLVYDIPHMAINGISASFLEHLCTEIPSLAGVKTSHKDAQAVRKLILAAPDYLTVLAGNESVALGLLALGANGLISGLSTAVPEPFVALTRAVAAGDLSAARWHQGTIQKLLATMPGQRRVGAIKKILTSRGIPVGPTVPPRLLPSGDFWPSMSALLVTAGLS